MASNNINKIIDINDPVMRDYVMNAIH